MCVKKALKIFIFHALLCIVVYLRRDNLMMRISEAFHYASVLGLDYVSFVEGLAEAYGYTESKRLRGDIVTWSFFVRILRSIIKDLKEVSEYESTLKLEAMQSQLRSLSAEPILSDCLGLPEVYWIKSKLEQKGISVHVEFYINKKGLTTSFKKVFREETMADVARQYEGYLFNIIDHNLHEYLEKEPLELEILIQKMNQYLKPTAERIADYMANIHKNLLADHGYDIVFQNNGYIVTHGNPQFLGLSRLSPLLIVQP
ncbi:MAG: hypothetical protein GU361_01585 [Desulfurococcales archaeon]|nr:hypothetical protein [Desulfurococcales archaeon]